MWWRRCQVIAKRLSGVNRWALVLVNFDSSPHQVAVRWDKLPAGPLDSRRAPMNVRDVWRHMDVGRYPDDYQVTLAAHESAMVIAQRADLPERSR